jgi:WD40 repeat protein
MNKESIIMANCFFSQGQYIVAGSDDGSFFIWDRHTTNIMRVLRGDDSIVNCLQPHPSYCLLATSGIDPVVRLWSPRPEVMINMFTLPQVLLNSLYLQNVLFKWHTKTCMRCISFGLNELIIDEAWVEMYTTTGHGAPSTWVPWDSGTHRTIPSDQLLNHFPIIISLINISRYSFGSRKIFCSTFIVLHVASHLHIFDR